MSTDGAKAARSTTANIDLANDGGGLNFIVSGFPHRLFEAPKRQSFARRHAAKIQALKAQ